MIKIWLICVFKMAAKMATKMAELGYKDLYLQSRVYIVRVSNFHMYLYGDRQEIM